MSREELLFSIEQLEEKNVVLADAQVNLTKSIANLKPEFEAMQARKLVLEEELKETERRIADKNAERNESLNQREAEIVHKEEHIKTSLAELDDRRTNLNQREEVLREEEKRISDLAQINAANATTLESERARLAARIVEHEKAVVDFISEQSRVSDLQSFLETQQSALNDKETEQVGRDIELDKREEALENLESLHAQREQSLTERDLALTKALLDLKEQNSVLDKRIAVVEEKEKYAEGQFKVIEEEKKKIQYEWLKINKKIQDNKLDLDLKELQK